MARRLVKELSELQRAPLDYCNCGPVENDDIMHWNAMLIGPQGSPYQAGVFNVDMTFPADYPFKPPKVLFKTRIYHPNINSKTGEICADVLTDKWGPTLNVRFVLNALKELLEDPHAENPLEPDIATQLSTNKAEFLKSAREHTAKYASN